MPQNRLFGVAAVLAKGVCAGSIESSNGSARVTPVPRRNVRRDRCFFEMKFICSGLLNDVISLHASAYRARASRLGEFSLTRIWNGALRTTPKTRSENL